MRLFDFDGTLVDSNGVWEEIDRPSSPAAGSLPPGIQ